MILSLRPLVGGGFFVAFAQLCTFYYACAMLLHHVVPLLVSVKSVQLEQRRSGSVVRDALYSLGERKRLASVQSVCVTPCLGRSCLSNDNRTVAEAC